MIVIYLIINLYFSKVNLVLNLVLFKTARDEIYNLQDWCDVGWMRVNMRPIKQVLGTYHAFFSLRRHTDFSTLKPSLACKIFGTMIQPILTYNNEVWGASVKSDFKSWEGSRIEKTHLHFCKRYLEVHNKSSNVACRAELGRFPLIVDINKRYLITYTTSKERMNIL